MKYVVNHPTTLKYPNAGILLGFMQYVSSIFVEVANLLLITFSDTISDSIFNFVALVAISEIDNWWAQFIQVNPFEDDFEEFLPDITNLNRDLKGKRRGFNRF